MRWRAWLVSRGRRAHDATTCVAGRADAGEGAVRLRELGVLRGLPARPPYCDSAPAPCCARAGVDARCCKTASDFSDLDFERRSKRTRAQGDTADRKGRGPQGRAPPVRAWAVWLRCRGRKVRLPALGSVFGTGAHGAEGGAEGGLEQARAYDSSACPRVPWSGALPRVTSDSES